MPNVQTVIGIGSEVTRHDRTVTVVTNSGLVCVNTRVHAQQLRAAIAGMQRGIVHDVLCSVIDHITERGDDLRSFERLETFDDLLDFTIWLDNL